VPTFVRSIEAPFNWCCSCGRRGGGGRMGSWIRSRFSAPVKKSRLRSGHFEGGGGRGRGRGRGSWRRGWRGLIFLNIGARFQMSVIWLDSVFFISCIKVKSPFNCSFVFSDGDRWGHDIGNEETG